MIERIIIELIFPFFFDLEIKDLAFWSPSYCDLPVHIILIEIYVT